MRQYHSLFAGALLLGAALRAQNPGQANKQVPPAAAAWWKVVTVLADDSLRGRATGTEDYVKAADYVAQEFKRAGLEPGASGSYLQTAHLATVRLIPERSGVVIVNGAAADSLRLGSDATVQVSTTTAPAVDAPLVFIGYGLHFPGARDDAAGVDLRGKAVVYLSRMPAGLSATMFAHGRSARWDALRAAGAAAAIAIADPAGSTAGGGRGAGGGGTGRLTMGLADDPSGGGGGVLINIRDSAAARLFDGSGHTLAEIRAMVAADSQRVLPAFPLAGRLHAWTALDRNLVDAPNVVGVLRGSDPTLRNQYVVVSAHLDHLGVGRPVNGDSIYNGAMDNASGVATLIETARAFQAQHVRPKRSLIFLAVTGEERGELGSAYFATHPTVPARDIVADLNTDMWEPLIPLTGVFGYGYDESDLGDDLRRVLAAHHLVVMDDPEPAQVRFIRSDQYSFIKRGIPALALKAGYRDGTPEQQVIAEFLRDRYHKPSDDVNQPINFETAVQFNAMYFDLVRAVADRPTRPAWFPNSVFRTQ